MIKTKNKRKKNNGTNIFFCKYQLSNIIKNQYYDYSQPSYTFIGRRSPVVATILICQQKKRTLLFLVERNNIFFSISFSATEFLSRMKIIIKVKIVKFFIWKSNQMMMMMIIKWKIKISTRKRKKKSIDRSIYLEEKKARME